MSLLSRPNHWTSCSNRNHRELARLDVVSLNADRQGSVDCAHRNHQDIVAVSSEKNTLHAVQRTAANSVALPYLQKRVRYTSHISVDDGSHRRDLLFGTCVAFRRTTHEANHTRRPSHHDAPF